MFTTIIETQKVKIYIVDFKIKKLFHIIDFNTKLSEKDKFFLNRRHIIKTQDIKKKVS